MSTTVNYKGSTIATVNNATKTLNTAGTWVEGDITLVDVTPGKYTATLIADGGIGTRFVKSNGTKYFTSGETFSFNGGDSLYIYATDTRGGSGEIYIDDVRVVGAQGYAEYTYTLPESNIEVSFGSNSTSVNSVSAISLQSKTVSYTPTETAQTATVTADSGYDGLSSVDISVGAISGTYVGSQVPTQAAQTIHPSTSAQTIASGKYLTGDQTIEAVTTTNLTAANIKSGVVVKVGSATDDDSVLSLTGTAETGGATLEDEANTTGTTAVITGTESSGGISIDDIATGEIGTDIVITSSTIRKYGFACTNITSVVADNVTDLSGGNAANIFNLCTNLTSIHMAELTSIGNSGSFCAGCTKLTRIYLPKIVDLGNYAFQSCTSLKAVALQSAWGSYQSFTGCSNLEVVDYGAKGTTRSGINVSNFANCKKLKVLILRGESYLHGLSNINAFNGSPFASGGSGGTIYIPKSLYDQLGTGTNDYKAATNWSTLDGYGTVTWAAIEGSQYENYYADGTAIS